MSNFPYINLTSKQLAELAEEHRHNVDILGDLLHELAFRKRKKAFAVRQKVIDYLNQKLYRPLKGLWGEIGGTFNPP